MAFEPKPLRIKTRLWDGVEPIAEVTSGYAKLLISHADAFELADALVEWAETIEGRS